MAKHLALFSLMDALPTNAAILDGRGRIVMVNRHWRSFARDRHLADPDFAVGRDYLAICDAAAAAGDADASRAGLCLRAVLAGAEGVYRVTYPCAPPGEEAWYEATITRVAGCRWGRALIQHVPATVRVLAERARDRFAAEKDTAWSEAQGRSRFLAAASHDLRQPLQAIALQLAALKTRPGDAWSDRVTDQIQTSLDGVARLLDRLLDISQVEAGAVVVRMAAVPVQRLLDQLAADFAPTATAKNLRFRMAPCGAEAITDAVLLGRILANLVSNALRYTERGGVLVGARRQGAAIRLRVHDTGIGIPESELARVFEEFYRGADDGGAPPGTGLGLAIVKRTAALLGHPIHAWSRPGRGSCFEVVVPVAGRPGGGVEPGAAAVQRSRQPRPLAGHGET